jgi:SAM-dependent methyltransferase
MPFEDGQFDACICLWSAFNELLDRPEQVDALREMHRVLRPGGLAIVEGPVFAPATADDLAAGRRLGPEARLESDIILGRRQLRYVHDQASLLRAAAAAGIATPRVEVRDWAGRSRQLLLFRRQPSPPGAVTPGVRARSPG